MQDVGFYVCTVTNSYGLDYRQAYLSVISKYRIDEKHTHP